MICTMTEINVGCEMCAFKVSVNLVFLPSSQVRLYNNAKIFADALHNKDVDLLLFWERVTHLTPNTASKVS